MDGRAMTAFSFFDQRRTSSDESLGKMLEVCTILSAGGVVLWTKAFNKLEGKPINSLIRNVLVEVR